VTQLRALVSFWAYWGLARCGPFDKVCLLRSGVTFKSQYSPRSKAILCVNMLKFCYFFGCYDAAQQVLMSVCLSMCEQVEILPNTTTQNIPECSKMFQNVQECSRMFHNVPECWLLVNQSHETTTNLKSNLTKGFPKTSFLYVYHQ